jgi:hypothetical protein
VYIYTLVSLYSTYTRTLTFDNICHRKPLQSSDFVHQPLHLLEFFNQYIY